jgi:signal transduction histidine kinase
MRRSTERNEELEKANRALESFAYTVSHDLRAPLRNLQGYVRAIKEDCFGQLDGNCRNHVQAMDDITVKMDGMIAEVLEFSRVSRSDLPSEHVELGPVLDESLALVKNTIEEKSAQVDVAIDRRLVVLGHHPTLVQALTNLLSNALKFVPEGAKPVLRVRSERRNAHRIRVWVEDEGIGIDPSQHKRIFEVFQRLHGEEKYPGTGIGLALVKEGVEGMGGHVGVESARGAGSRFWVELRAGS